ncbi:serine carboxypeptidase domain-containing protein [Ditylenchus destructor]|uniref:Serine carboxypeptidase domain-containing protein n=1 Tax=Ditylenchus destructor TaxID=166010 RepID=A0AAD4MYK5_9BILA|nr:serine carboxypeptidase domain-containing protein [Ditylenchus destructor]
MLSKRILDGQEDFPVKLEGLAIGNGYVNEKLDNNTLIEFFHGHGLIDETVWNQLKTNCCDGCVEGCDIYSSCRELAVDILRSIVNAKGYYRLDIIRPCAYAPAEPEYNDDSLFVNTYAKNMNHKRSNTTCYDMRGMTAYMNRMDVREVFHIRETFDRWRVCRHTINYTYIYKDMTPFVNEAIKHGVRVFLFYGDTDAACNFIQGQRFVESLGIPVKQRKQAWHYKDQIAGYKTSYEKGLTFATVSGVGHMAVEWKPAELAYAMKQFINNEPI